MTAENEARGRSSRRKGYAWMRRCIQALRTNGWPHAEIIPSHGRSDIGGVGDLAVECKDVMSWSHLSDELRQAARDARFRDLPDYVVWRKRHGFPDPMDGYCLMDARSWWAHWKRHQELEAVELEFASWRAGLAAAQAASQAIDTARAEVRKMGDAAAQAREAAG